MRTTVLITAGDARSIAAEALGELLRRNGIDVVGILLVSWLNVGRLRRLVQQRGLRGVLRRFRRSSAGLDARDQPQRIRSPLEVFLEGVSIRPVGIRSWARAAGIPIWTVSDLNCSRSIAVVRQVSPSVIAYCGGGILRTPFLQIAPNVLNAHAGPLPEIRGMNAAEWAAMLKLRAEVSIHRIDAGIDTGEVVARKSFDRTGCRSVDALREQAVVHGIQGLCEVISARTFDSHASQAKPAVMSRQCFIMAPVLVEMLQSELASQYCPHDASP